MNLPDRLLEQKIDEGRLAGDAVVASFFVGDKPKARKATLARVEHAVGKYPPDWDASRQLRAELLREPHAVRPFHWELEFPEVFAREVFLVANPRAVDKQGVRNEIQIASDVARKIGDAEFIIPLRLAPFEAPFLIAHAQYIDFQRGWAAGLAELLTTLDETYQIPRGASGADTLWRDIQLIHAKAVVTSPERLVSNWLSLANQFVRFM